MSIVTLKAHRAGALIVGEELGTGTVEPWVRDYLPRGLLNTSMLWLEMDKDETSGSQALAIWQATMCGYESRGDC
ncbi:hypothetical protein [Mycobacterium uberis]|uniref:hypothetical protein n=1 Tax=Mycobacterium uberis TaxID=2162698 RepID=UPI001A9EA339|nr:hypothetical protein [Mycobacterium uberis]